MNSRKLLLIVLAVLALFNPLLWRILGPIVLVGLGLAVWCLVFQGIAAVVRSKKPGK